MKQQGYFFLDHRNSPGFSEAEARVVNRPAGSKLFEADTLTCAHCKTVMVKNPERTRERAFCRKCMTYICDGCEWLSRQPGYFHTPFDRLVDDTKDGKLVLFPTNRS